MNRKKSLLIILGLFTGIAAYAQQSTGDSVKAKPANVAVKEDFKDDWAALSHYVNENKALGDPKPGEKRVVFLGSSIFEFWKTKVPEFFEGRPYLDRG
ncbi:MAG: hypothetical protein AAGC65_11530, partial [Mucilaginibacter sp.]